MLTIEKTITSMEVAEMVGRSHNDVLKDIRNIIKQLGEGKNSQSYFSESFYRNSQNKKLPCYLITKKGCELYSTRMTGAKGTQFAVAYIERFNEMETHIKKQAALPASPREQLKLMYQFQEETAERVDIIEESLNKLKDNQLLSEPDYATVSNMVRRKIAIISDEQHLNNKHKKELFADLNGSIKKITGAVARNRIKAKDFEKVVKFINNWQPSSATWMIIEQMKLEGVEQ